MQKRYFERTDRRSADAGWWIGAMLSIVAAMIFVAGASAGQQPAAPAAQQPAAQQPAAAAAPSATDTEPLPSATEILQRNVEARGGEAALRKHRHITWKGTFEMPGMGIKGDVLLHASAPNLFHLTIEAPGVGTITQGFDGTVGWADNPMTGPTVNSGKELEMTKIQSDFYADLNTAEYFSKIETVGRETYAGEPSYKVAFTTKGGMELFTYYSVATGLMVGTTGNFPTPMGEVFVETETSDFKEFDGALYPTTSVQKAMGAEQVLKLTEPDFGEIDPAIYALPEAVKTLVAGQPAQ
ncbi:MAG TPA: hypothetical protein VHR17_12620 [Thermoanaerobaculia bacterium]|nr:hypothetical protein [Thermoanaerobaculia bacterium]